MSLEPVSRARAQQGSVVRKVPVHGQPLNAGPLRDRRDRGGGRAQRLVKLDGGLDDSLPGVFYTHIVNITVYCPLTSTIIKVMLETD
jgi:hypothetical protein